MLPCANSPPLPQVVEKGWRVWGLRRGEGGLTCESVLDAVVDPDRCALAGALVCVAYGHPHAADFVLKDDVTQAWGDLLCPQVGGGNPVRHVVRAELCFIPVSSVCKLQQVLPGRVACQLQIAAGPGRWVAFQLQIAAGPGRRGCISANAG